MSKNPELTQETTRPGVHLSWLFVTTLAGLLVGSWAAWATAIAIMM